MHDLIKKIIIAGLIGQISFELYAWFLSPILFGVTLEPANLVIALGMKIAGLGLGYVPAFVIHLLIGIVLFPLTVLGVRSLLRCSLILAGLLAGIGLWFVAQGVLAPFIGRSFMMGFGAYTQSSFIGHVGMTVVIALVLERIFPRIR